MKIAGGQEIVDRLLKAYGFATKKELGDYFGLGNGTVSTWIKRNYFPGEQVVRCVLEKGVSLKWLATGIGEMYMSEKDIVSNSFKNIVQPIEKMELIDGALVASGFWHVENSLIDSSIGAPVFIDNGEKCWIVDTKFDAITEGYWLNKKSDIISVDFFKLAPRENFLISGIEWPRAEVEILAKVKILIERFTRK